MFLHKVLTKGKRIWEQLMACQIKRVTREGEREFPCLFSKIEKKLPGF